ncbi:YrbL family protein [Luteimonas suaedae]|uniref:YrbL family protein n=1 Tax=Luteimonas suaedae TaxID=2605430 RepID=UPI0011EE6968|nr:YrbL family protein [Luteimonas suaedae]
MHTNGAGQWRDMQVIAHGACRICVRDPGAPGHCLKYELPPAAGARDRRRRQLRHLLSSRLAWFGDNHRELRAWQRLRARLDDGLSLHVAECEGIVATPAGRALRCRMVADGNGDVAPSLLHCLTTPAAGASAAALCAAVDRFEAWLLAQRVPLSDLNPGNFVVVRRDGALALVCVDVKSVIAGKELIPVSHWSWTWMRRKIRRRAARLRDRIRASMEPYALAASPAPL